MTDAYFIGIDVGTQGARVAVFDARGAQLAAHGEVFALSAMSRQEQDARLWWNSCYRSLQQVCKELSAIIDLSLIKSIGVTSTSGTIIPMGQDDQPLYPAIMYSDGRSVEEALACKEAAINAGAEGYIAFNTSSGLPKMLWFLRNHPDKIVRLKRFVHASDFITGTLSGNFGVTDYTNVLKSGYDLHNYRWPDYITASSGIRRVWLQDVVPSGTPIGTLKKEWAKDFGLPESVVITAGITDGCASQIASGAVKPGDWNTTIGTTLVVKGVTQEEIQDPGGVIYCHRHPEGFWMPGGASNTGADWVSSRFGGADLAALSEAAAALVPGQQLAWPLMQKGERFPFIAPYAVGFAPEGLSDEVLFTAYMEGVAYIERYAFDRIRKLSGEPVTQVFSAGGASNSETWLKIRSNVLNTPVRKMKNVTGAAGAAIIAASKTWYSDIREAAAQMVHPEKIMLPEPSLVTAYDTRYEAFIELLKEKKYINE
ncbi:FGGY-family carbohydrate kinase [Niabella sp. CJ426]|uniref:FGGY-family carbohydrate kinase n=1 Tax=Niabella sp. CJ426 TaxID=3393740 RepID=UPI003D074BBD